VVEVVKVILVQVIGEVETKQQEERELIKIKKTEPLPKLAYRGVARPLFFV
jgi:hypothetical protein